MSGAFTLPETAQTSQLHVLVVGAKGAGKSTLVKRALGSGHTISQHSDESFWEQAPGQSSLRNPRIVFHELLYTDAENAPDRISQVDQFLVLNALSGHLSRTVHVIWFCAAVPYAAGPNHPALDDAEISFISRQEVPVAVIFTQFDKVLSVMEDELSLPDNATDEDTEALTLQRSNIRFEESCVASLASLPKILPFTRTTALESDAWTKESDALMRKFLETTCAAGDDYIARKQWALSVGPSLQTVSNKIEVSIKLALRVYFRVLFSSRISVGSLETITDKLHRQITRIWKLEDPFVRRDSEQFILGVRRISSFSPDYWSQNKSWTNILDRYQVLITLILGSSVSMTLGYAIAAFVVCLWIAHIIFRMLHRIPETLRAFLEYTIHLTLLLDRIFLNSLTSPSPSAQSTRTQPHALSAEDIERALQEYAASQAAAQVHSEVQLFMDHTCESTWRMCRGLRRRRAEELVKELVWKWRTDAQRGPTARR
ncbi:hypothetical protein MKEN_00847800 [Mycena kentingensis (nom. inval.)]|nr:hypothetical protein MKEN_00847800 [Mycena kentingensis (nom. inval.)]